MCTHGWVGLNYVATDYVQISKAMMGPARIVNVGIAIVTLIEA
jgi:succinate dehydrogenase hydrophobic anchor subunit